MTNLSPAASTALIDVRKAAQAMKQAATDTATVADELRRYQKFAKPGQPSPHLVQVRQSQARVRQASNQAKQAFLTASMRFVREAALKVPTKLSLEAYVTAWLAANPEA
ncbi:hypothetical protein BJI69_19005 [Luteibacter rhizovicinus DSM 16549]|uniref:Uncharacterized protein n=1 Tax=Luteibacter rhizovicinus DSM 16549 TaxID=1440763 RepID=A0A1L3EXP5_9GAMM|nr:hypothetical protein [Luteibacter rhizovicinus]APG05784.1 hypothetical protein BJI69_19005 [Luteibacter rhizovicinus DSM 16549]